MIIRGTPKDINNYIKADNKLSRFLQGKQFLPIYMDNKFIYYYKTDKIEEALLEYSKVVKND